MTQPSTTLETFANPAPERDYTIRMTIFDDFGLSGSTSHTLIVQ